jgi:hypothetical protein
LKEVSDQELSLTLLDDAGQVIRRFSSRKPAEDDPTKTDDGPKEPRLPARAGLNRFNWDTRYPDAETISGDAAGTSGVVGPQAKPGSYQARLQVGDYEQTIRFEIIKDPRLTTNQAVFESQFALLIAIRDKLTATHRAVKQLRSVREQVESWLKRAGDWPDGEAMVEAANEVKHKLDAIETTLILPPGPYGELSMNEKARLNGKLANLVAVVASADRSPTRQAGEMFAELAAEIDEQLHRLQVIMEQDVPALNEKIRRLNIPAILPPDHS